MSKKIETLSKITEAMEAIKDSITGKVLKSYPMRSEWRKRYEALEIARNEAHVAEEKMKILKRSFWSQVELDLDIYDKELQYNSETDEIELMED